jgi:hypothetical protein
MRITYVNYQRRVRNFIQKSTVSKATIIDRWECYDEEAGRIDHWITYTYVITNQDGAEQTITLRKIIYQAYEQFEVGSTVDVRYLPDDPQTCMLEDDFQDFMRTKGKSFITPDMPRDEAGTVQKT